MHMCFLDESGTPTKLGKETPEYFVIGGIIIPEQMWHEIRNKFIGLKREMKYKGEVKWRFFAPKNNDDLNPMREWDHEKRNEFRNRVFQIITSHNSLKLLACVCHCKSAYAIERINTQDDIYFETYKPVTERFQYFLQDLGKESGSKVSGIVVADHRGSHDDTKMRNQHERLVRTESKFTTSYANFIEGLFFSPSHMSIGIQLADMVAGATWRSFERADSSFFDQIKGSFRKNPNSRRIEGFGLVKFPKSFLSDVG